MMQTLKKSLVPDVITEYSSLNYLNQKVSSRGSEQLAREGDRHSEQSSSLLNCYLKSAAVNLCLSHSHAHLNA